MSAPELTVPDWHPFPYAGWSLEHVLSDYALVRGDLSEQYAREQVVTMVDAIVQQARADALNEAADTIESIAKDRLTRFLWRGPVEWLRGKAKTSVLPPGGPA